jgi:membrane-associated HD superfamily phosphohydrolase
MYVISLILKWCLENLQIDLVRIYYGNIIWNRKESITWQYTPVLVGYKISLKITKWVPFTQYMSSFTLLECGIFVFFCLFFVKNNLKKRLNIYCTSKFNWTDLYCCHVVESKQSWQQRQTILSPSSQWSRNCLSFRST